MTDTVHLLLIVIPVLLVSMTVHEMMHAFASYWLGDDTAYHQGRLSLNPFVHIDPILTLGLPIVLALIGAPIFAAAKPVQVNFHRLRWGEFGGAIVGGIGPASNLVMAVISAVLLNSLSPIGTTGEVLAYFVAINIGLAIFNLIPWPPLDGSRVLYAFAPRPLQEVMEAIERMGMAGLVLFILVFYQFLAPYVGNLMAQLTNGLINI